MLEVRSCQAPPSSSTTCRTRPCSTPGARRPGVGVVRRSLRWRTRPAQRLRPISNGDRRIKDHVPRDGGTDLVKFAIRREPSALTSRGGTGLRKGAGGDAQTKRSPISRSPSTSAPSTDEPKRLHELTCVSVASPRLAPRRSQRRSQPMGGLQPRRPARPLPGSGRDPLPRPARRALEQSGARHAQPGVPELSVRQKRVELGSRTLPRRGEGPDARRMTPSAAAAPWVLVIEPWRLSARAPLPERRVPIP